ASGQASEQPCRRARQHYPSVTLLEHDLPGGACDVEAALQVHVEDRLDLLCRHTVEFGVTPGAGVVDDDVHGPELLERKRGDLLAALLGGSRRVGRDGAATGRAD